MEERRGDEVVRRRRESERPVSYRKRVRGREQAGQHTRSKKRGKTLMEESEGRKRPNNKGRKYRRGREKERKSVCDGKKIRFITR